MLLKQSPPCEKFRPLRHAAACFKTPTNSSQNLALQHAAVCCGMLLPLVLAATWQQQNGNEAGWSPLCAPEPTWLW